jgi:cyclohexadienyl dehydratase
MISSRSLFFLLLLTPAVVFADDENLFGLIGERLGYMHKVAAYKWVHGLPIEDLQRENVVLDHATSDGLEYGIRVAMSRAFFRQQIEAAKEIQHYWFEHWKDHPVPQKITDLNTVIRPELVRLGKSITALLGRTSSLDARDDFLATINIEGLSAGGKQALYEALRAITFYDHRLQQILDAGVLRVGTTGDYAPFSFRESPGEPFTGIDIDLAMNLARSLDVDIRFVKTQWSSLLADLDAGRYDIAMSGVSRILARQQAGFFSSPYHRGGKTPISLCKNINKFNTLEKIDRKPNRIIVNPGGTNERYVDAHIKQAQKVLHRDNRTIFDEIIRGNADLMITDEIEVQLQSARHDQLCATMPDQTLTYQDKGYLMPQDERLKEYVNLWLARRKSDGTVQSTFGKHLR